MGPFLWFVVRYSMNRVVMNFRILVKYYHAVCFQIVVEIQYNLIATWIIWIVRLRGVMLHDRILRVSWSLKVEWDVSLSRLTGLLHVCRIVIGSLSSSLYVIFQVYTWFIDIYIYIYTHQKVYIYIYYILMICSIFMYIFRLYLFT